LREQAQKRATKGQVCEKPKAHKKQREGMRCLRKAIRLPTIQAGKDENMLAGMRKQKQIVYFESSIPRGRAEALGGPCRVAADWTV